MSETFLNFIRDALPRITWERTTLPRGAIGFIGGNRDLGVRIVLKRFDRIDGSHAYDGAASGRGAVVHLTPEVAREAFEAAMLADAPTKTPDLDWFGRPIKR